MNRSQIVAWASEIGSVVFKLLNNNHDQQPSATTNDGEDSVQEGKVTPHGMISSQMSRESALHKARFFRDCS